MPPQELQATRARCLMQGATPLSDVDLLAILLGSAHLARSLSRRQPRWWELGPADLESLRFSSGRAAQVLAVAELARRIGAKPLERGAALCCSDDVAAAYGSHLRQRKQEVFLVVALDARNCAIAAREVAQGTLTSVEVHPREVFRPLIQAGAAAAIALHNHPSGDAEPSHNDHALCQRLRDAGATLGIPLLDFVIVGDGTHVSFADRDWLPGGL